MMITEVDSPDSLSDNIIPVISPVSPLTLGIYYNKSISGCMRRCPCRTWAQCHYYNSTRWKKLRGEENLYFEEINEWYENFFKYKPGLPDATYANG